MSPVLTKTSGPPDDSVPQLIDVVHVLVRQLSTMSAAGLPRSSVASRRPSVLSDSGTAHSVPDVDPGNVTIAPLDSLCDVRHRVINRKWKRYLEGAGDRQTVGSAPVCVLVNSSEKMRRR
jgi:hypothetical protein